MADIESLQIEIQAALCTLSEERLKEVCGGLEINLPPESKGRWVFIRALIRDLQILGRGRGRERVRVLTVYF